jgi:predicted N-acyltransferase
VPSEADAPSPHLSLFNRPQFLRLNLSPASRPVRFDHVVDGKLVGSLCGVVVADELVSGHSAPFGGPDLLRESESAATVQALLRSVVDQARADGVRTVRVKAKPAFYSGSEVEVQFALLNLGFGVEAAELNFHLDLTGLASVEDYVARLKPPARRALKHAVGEPFTFGEATTDQEWARAYAVLDHNRRAKGRQLRLSLEYVLAARDAFPGQIRMHALAHGGEPCAAALVYTIRPRHDLVVYWGDADHELPRSPMNVLVRDLVGHEIAAGTSTLDIGTSSVAGVPNQGLIQFKESVGARPSLRLDLVGHL